MDVIKLMEVALQTETAAVEAFDLAVHIAMVEAVKEVSARWPRRRVELTAGMGSCTIDVPGAIRGRPILWRFYWNDAERRWNINDVHYTDDRPHQVAALYRIVVESDLITQISQMTDEVHRDPISYAPTILCIGGKVVPEAPDEPA